MSEKPKKSVRMSGNLPGKKVNGFVEHHERFCEEERPERVVVIAVIERDTWQFKEGSGDISVGTKFTAIEPLEGEAAEAALKQLEKIREQRTGETTLDLEDEA